MILHHNFGTPPELKDNGDDRSTHPRPVPNDTNGAPADTDRAVEGTGTQPASAGGSDLGTKRCNTTTTCNALAPIDATVPGHDGPPDSFVADDNAVARLKSIGGPPSGHLTASATIPPTARGTTPPWSRRSPSPRTLKDTDNGQCCGTTGGTPPSCTDTGSWCLDTGGGNPLPCTNPETSQRCCHTIRGHSSRTPTVCRSQSPRTLKDTNGGDGRSTGEGNVTASFQPTRGNKKQSSPPPEDNTRSSRAPRTLRDLYTTVGGPSGCPTTLSLCQDPRGGTPPPLPCTNPRTLRPCCDTTSGHSTSWCHDTGVFDGNDTPAGACGAFDSHAMSPTPRTLHDLGALCHSSPPAVHFGDAHGEAPPHAARDTTPRTVSSPGNTAPAYEGDGAAASPPYVPPPLRRLRASTLRQRWGSTNIGRTLQKSADRIRGGGPNDSASPPPCCSCTRYSTCSRRPAGQINGCSCLAAGRRCVSCACLNRCRNRHVPPNGQPPQRRGLAAPMLQLHQVFHMLSPPCWPNQRLQLSCRWPPMCQLCLPQPLQEPPRPS